METPQQHFARIIALYKEGSFEKCSLESSVAKSRFNNHLFEQIDIYFKNKANSSMNVYQDSPHSFEAFINNGSNVPLYENVSKALNEEYQQMSPNFSLLDIGAGDGRALIPAIQNSKIEKLEIVEPASKLLKELANTLQKSNPQLNPVLNETTIQNYMEKSSNTWDLVQASFSLQSLRKEERKKVFKWLRNRCKFFILVEFNTSDIMEKPIMNEERINFIFNAIKKGMEEYKNTDVFELVSQGFLIPVMLGWFDEKKERTNYEEPTDKWIEDIESSGFKLKKRKNIFPYWWADAVLLEFVPEPLKVLIVEKGFSSRLKLLKDIVGEEMELEMPPIPEPTDDLKSGVATLQNLIEKWKPDVLIASSRGGKLVGNLIQSKHWNGPTLLISAMSTSEACVAGIPMIVVHGKNDVSIPIQAVKNDVFSTKDNRMKLIELDDDHSAMSIFKEGRIKNLIEDAFKLQFQPFKISNAPPTNMRASLLKDIKLRK